MKIYRLLIAAAIRYRKAITWADTHRYETADMMFINGAIIAISGLMLLFGSANAIWIGVAAIGVTMVIAAKTLLETWAKKTTTKQTKQ